MIITNFYDSENVLQKAISPLFLDELMFSTETAPKLDAKKLASVPEKDKRIACVIEYLGYKVLESKNSRSALIRQEWRISVVAPSELYNSMVGATMLDVARNVLGIKSELCRGSYELIDDVHQFHRPMFDTNLTKLHVSVGYTGIIKPNVQVISQ